MCSFASKMVMILSLLCWHSKAVVAEGLPPQVEQLKKILVTEKAQWAYIEKVFGEKLEEHSDQGYGLWFKHHPIPATAVHVLLGVGSSTVVSFAAGIVLAVCGVEVNGINAFLTATCICVAIEAALVALTRYFAQLPEFSPVTCLQAFESFISKWPAHREKVPHMLQIMFDDMYKQRSNEDFSAQRAQKLVEGIMALSAVAQLA
jgi:hypothetical protein